MEQFRNSLDNGIKKEKEDMGKFLEKKEIRGAGLVLERAGFDSYLVGGCVRDILLQEMRTTHSTGSGLAPAEPKDWDIATNAKPEKIQELFPDSVYENEFGTVAIKTESEDPALKIIEITTYRSEGKYTDKRHPDEVKFAEKIDDDLARRDFTVNALAIELKNGELGKIVDLFGGEEDLKNKIIRAVGNPEERFQEDALRLMRAVRFMAQLSAQGGPAPGWVIEEKTEEAIRKHAGLLEFISKERIRDEFSKILMTENAASGILKMEELGLLKYVLPELEEGIGVAQNKHHIFTIFEHNIKSLEYAAQSDFSLIVRIAALLHDVAKPRAKQGEGEDSTFYAHQVIGERMAVKILDKLHFSKDVIEKVALLIREHMFVYDPETVTDAGARRLLRRVGPESIEDLFKLREADRIGSGVPKAQPYRLRHLRFRLEKVSRDPISVKMLKVNGEDIMREANLEPGPKIGYMLSILLEEALDDPLINDKQILIGRIKELAGLEERKLEEMAKFARKSADEAQTDIEEELKKKYFVK